MLRNQICVGRQVVARDHAHWDAREFLEGMARPTGQRLGTALAAPFEVFPMGWGD